MKWLFILCFFICLAGHVAAHDPLAAFEGRWYVNLSSFPMWLKGNKHFPAFTYSVAIKGRRKGLGDVVSYRQKGRLKTITGFDTPTDSAATAFTWRGKGLLAMFKSRWTVVFNAGDWILIHFEKTLATPAGYDVISRHQQPSAGQLAAINAKLQQLGISGLQHISQQ